MASPKLCACDRTDRTLIGIKLELVDTVHVPFAKLVEIFSTVPESGVWLNHFRGIPKGPRLSRFDVIYLDQEGRVLDSVESFTAVEFEPLQERAESALIFPAHSLASFRVQPGDQLRICQPGKVIAGEPAIPGERCIRDTGPIDAPAEIKRDVPASVATSDAQPKKLTLTERFLRWLYPEVEDADRRRGKRLPAHNLVAYYWTGGSPVANKVGDISQSGLYLFTDERWFPGTRLVMTLQREGANAPRRDEISRVESEVVRWGENGIGCRFVESGFVNLNSGELIEGRVFDREAFDRFLERVHRDSYLESGQSHQHDDAHSHKHGREHD